MSGRRFLLACHDAGGTIPPMLAIAEALVRSGPRRVDAEPAVGAGRRAEARGLHVRPASRRFRDYEPRSRSRTSSTLTCARHHRRVGRRRRLRSGDRRHEVDLVVVDANLGGGLAAAEALSQPSVVLLHSMYKTFVDTWFGDFWPLLEAGDQRDARRLRTRRRRRVAVGVRRARPTALGRPDGVRRAGRRRPDHDAPLRLPRPAARPAADDGRLPGRRRADRPRRPQHHLPGQRGCSRRSSTRSSERRPGLVTTAGQVDREALHVPPNVSDHRLRAHAPVLADTDVMVTHAGLGSVAAALSLGVPLVCTPISRDQPLNAERVAELGAGVALTDAARPPTTSHRPSTARCPTRRVERRPSRPQRSVPKKVVPLRPRAEPRGPSRLTIDSVLLARTSLRSPTFARREVRPCPEPGSSTTSASACPISPRRSGTTMTSCRSSVSERGSRRAPTARSTTDRTVLEALSCSSTKRANPARTHATERASNTSPSWSRAAPSCEKCTSGREHDDEIVDEPREFPEYGRALRRPSGSTLTDSCSRPCATARSRRGDRDPVGW